MKFSVNTVEPGKQHASCVVLPVFEKNHLSPAGEKLNKLSRGYFSDILENGDNSGKTGELMTLYHPPRINTDRVILVGCGKIGKTGANEYKTIVNAVAESLKTLNTKDAISYLTQVTVESKDTKWKTKTLIQTLDNAFYVFNQLKSTKKPAPKLSKICISVEQSEDLKQAKSGLKIGTALCSGIKLTKTLANLPGNICTPTYLAEESKKLTKHKNISVEVLEEKELDKLGMGSFLSVSRGSREPAKLIIIKYQGGNASEAPHCLVGKGVTFDSGGISIKPGAAMDEMKYDMCGAASVFGTLSAVAQLKLPLNVFGIIPATENLPDGDASKPGDIVTSMSGQTIEVLNTDAEGRLILCDALTFCAKYKPKSVVDIATLTGACVIALGGHATGLLGNDDDLINDLLDAGKSSGDRAWQLPLWDEYDKQLSSNFADMANIGGREAGTITAACFLSRYTKSLKWAHLDIAGTAWLSGKQKGATGRPVSLLTQYLIDQCPDNE